MSHFLLRFLFAFLALLFTQCTGNNSAALPEFTSEDSLQIIDVILDSMKVEMDEKIYYPDDGSIIVCFPRSYLDVIINQSNQITVRGEIRPYNISDRIVKFYSTNLFKNDWSSNDVIYTRLTRNQVEQELAKIKSIIDHFELKIKKDSIEKQDLEILNYQKENLKDWQQIHEVFGILKVDTFAQTDMGARINLYYPKKCKIKNQILESLFLGYYKVRELDAKIYFKESYAEIFWKATKYNDSISLQRLKALKVLHPIQIVDKNKYPDAPGIPPKKLN